MLSLQIKTFIEHLYWLKWSLLLILQFRVNTFLFFSFISVSVSLFKVFFLFMNDVIAHITTHNNTQLAHMPSIHNTHTCFRSIQKFQQSRYNFLYLMFFFNSSASSSLVLPNLITFHLTLLDSTKLNKHYDGIAKAILN